MPRPPQRREAELERADVVLVDAVRLGVARGRQLLLGLEPLALVDRVVELAERVAELAAEHDRLEPLDQRGIVAVRARERRHLRG